MSSGISGDDLPRQNEILGLRVDQAFEPASHPGEGIDIFLVVRVAGAGVQLEQHDQCSHTRPRATSGSTIAA